MAEFRPDQAQGAGHVDVFSDLRPKLLLQLCLAGGGGGCNWALQALVQQRQVGAGQVLGGALSRKALNVSCNSLSQINMSDLFTTEKKKYILFFSPMPDF